MTNHMKYIIIFVAAIFLLVSPGRAEQSVEQQVYTATTNVMHTVANLGQRVMDDEAQMAVLRKQVADLTKEREDLKTKKSAPAEPSP